MRGKNNNNYLETRKLCNNMSKVFQIPKTMTFNYLNCMHKAIIHRIAEESLNNEGLLDSVKIEIPFIGILILDIKDDMVIVKSIELEDEFKLEVLDAIIDGKSPLVISAEESLVKTISKRYDSLI